MKKFIYALLALSCTAAACYLITSGLMCEYHIRDMGNYTHCDLVGIEWQIWQY